MRHPKRTLQPTRSGSDKPVAPPDLWAQMDALLPNHKATRPPNSFTVQEFAKRKGISRVHAATILVELMSAGKLTRVKVEAKWHYQIVVR
jgi:hypothetical protein